MRRAFAIGLALACAAAGAQPLAPLAAGADGRTPAAPWAFAGLPDQKLPRTRFAIETADGAPVLRVEADASYGNLLQRLPGTPAGTLSWRWRVERPLAAADLRTKAGDDAALKVCALFDMPRERVPFVERQLLRLAENRTGEALPNATLCYVWDPAWPAGSIVPNAFSRRVRYLTLGQPGTAWQAVRRDLAADFVQAFGDESPTVPALQAIALGADADNTGGHSLGFIADLVLRAAP